MNTEASPQPGPDRVRLHITPFNAELFEKVVPATAKATASNISYHAVQTFPDRGFGFLELPKMEADKLKKKLNGSTLKGTKVRVEEAKKERKRKGRREEGDAEAEDEEERRARKKAKKEKKKREEGVIPGYELEVGRHVKRGWSEEKGKKSKDSRESKKLLFRAAVPPNAAPVEDKSKPKSKDKKEKKEKKRKDGKTEKTVKEFTKSTKPVADDTVQVDRKSSLAYEDGKGWVDETGKVTETEPPSKKRKRRHDEVTKARETAAAMEAEAATLREKAAIEAAKPPSPEPADESEVDSVEDGTDSESSSEDEERSDESDVDAPDDAPAEPTAIADKPSTPPPTDSPREIHPLEALYKRKVASPSDERKPKLNPIDTSFSFFNPDAEDEEVNVAQPGRPPQTPHTKQDLEWRSLRSAAPTPDTAAIGKRFKFPFEAADGDDEELDDEEMQDAIGGAAQDSGTAKPTEGEEREESEFRKWFYEKRGDNNRAWKKMRRDAKKQQRQRENRRLSRRVV